MSLFAISDLHLSFYKNKPMDIFGDNWKQHHKVIKTNWISIVKEDDMVLIPGDISWAQNLKEFEPDMNFIHNLPGKKVFISGNHDYWWTSTSKLNDIYKDMLFLKNSFTEYNNIAICGTRGWLCPNDTYFTEHDKKIYLREVKRLEMSLESALKGGYEDIILIMHFPPTNDKKEISDFINVINNYNIKKVIYGHLHGEKSFNSSYKGNVNGIEYILVSSDYVNFMPIKIL